MPITLSDIEVDIDVIEYEEDSDLYRCSVCEIEVERTRDYKAIPHTLDICLKNLKRRLGLGEPRI